MLTNILTNMLTLPKSMHIIMPKFMLPVAELGGYTSSLQPQETDTNDSMY